MAEYQEKILDLSVQLDRKEIIGAGTPIDSVYINGALPGGVTIKLHAGARAGLVVREFASIELCPAENQGLFLSTSGPAPGSSLSLILGTGLAVQGGA